MRAERNRGYAYCHIPTFATAKWGYGSATRVAVSPGSALHGSHGSENQVGSSVAKPYRLTDGYGLFLVVQPNGSKLWRWKYRFQGEYRLMAFGRYPEVTLAQARARHATARSKLHEGTDPMAERRAEKSGELESRRKAKAAARGVVVEPLSGRGCAVVREVEGGKGRATRAKHPKSP